MRRTLLGFQPFTETNYTHNKINTVCYKHNPYRTYNAYNKKDTASYTTNLKLIMPEKRRTCLSYNPYRTDKAYNVKNIACLITDTKTYNAYNKKDTACYTTQTELITAYKRNTASSPTTSRVWHVTQLRQN